MPKIYILKWAMALSGLLTLVSQADAQFVLYQRIFQPGTPGLSPYMTRYNLDYNAVIGGSNGKSCTPDTAQIRGYANEGLGNPTVPVSFDVEINWPAYNTQAFTDSMNNFIKVVNDFKGINNVSKVGFYSVPPQQIYGNYNNVGANFAPTAQAMNPLASAVDYFSPDWYNYGSTDTTNWRKMADTTLAVIRKYYGSSKPIYPYISADPSGTTVIDSSTWLFVLRYVYAHCDGALVWNNGSPAWDANAPWWRSTKMFLVQKGLAPPFVLTNWYMGDISSGGATLRWSTSSDTISQYFVVQRSTDNVNFSPVSPQIYKNGYSYSQNQYLFNDSTIVPVTGQTIYYRLAIKDLHNNVSYSDTLAYTKKMYRSAGLGTSVRLDLPANWQTYNGTAWVTATAAPASNMGTEDTIIVRSADTLQDPTQYQSVAGGATLIDSGSIGTLSWGFTNNGTIVFAGTHPVTIPGTAVAENGTYGNLVIADTAGVTVTQGGANNLHVNSLFLQSGTFTIGATGGATASLYLDGPVSVGGGHLTVTASGLNGGVIVNGKVSQTLPSGTFLNNTISTLTLSNGSGFICGGPLTVTNNTHLTRQAPFSVSGNYTLDSLTIDTLSTSTPVTVSGTATLAGVLTVKSFAAAPAPGAQYTILSAASISGTLTSAVLPTGYNGMVSKVGNNVILTITVPQIQSGAIYEIKTALNNTSNLDVANGDTANFTKVQLYTDNSSSSQRWKAVSVAGGYFKLVSQKNTAKCMDVSGAGNTNGVQIDIYTDNGTNAQKWTITNVGGNYFTLSPACAPGKVLDDSNALTTNGNKIQIWTANGSNAQKWLFQLITPPTGMAAPNESQVDAMTTEKADTAKASLAGLKIYPNPVSGSCFIQSSRLMNLITVYDNGGHPVRTIGGLRTNQYIMNLAGLSPGIYYVRINNDPMDQAGKVVKMR